MSPSELEDFLAKVENYHIGHAGKKGRHQERADEELDKSCTFTPMITNKSRTIWEKREMRPIYERYQQEARDKTDRLHELRKQHKLK